ncbi:hypothetical protein C8N36_12082 [Pelagimonas varians]|uniref:Uncharacterized protein n=1 Tax=Pelagimonas varians TaxID=696760 RepID=A0A238L2Q2_9RHOB|nr:hypothetical protein C8N36_12082 [Pelagimonas varians]SMX49228.1 hypothetical protein PEV8663_04137 [Pelagimonas varians]
MRDAVDHLKDQNLDRCTPRLDQSEIAETCLLSGSPEGFSMEWVFDRYDQSSPQIGRRN